MLSRFSIFYPRRRSLLRGVLLALLALWSTMRLAGFPAPDAPHPSRWQLVPLLLVAASMADTSRCLGRRWTLYHAGVLLLLYSELMILILVLFLWIYP